MADGLNFNGLTHISIFVVAVGSQKHFGNFIHPAEEERQLSLVGMRKTKLKAK